MQRGTTAISQTVFATRAAIREIKNVATMAIKKYYYPIIEGNNVKTCVATQHVISSFSMRNANRMCGLQIRIPARILSSLGLQTLALLQLIKEVLPARIAL